MENNEDRDRDRDEIIAVGIAADEMQPQDRILNQVVLNRQ